VILLGSSQFNPWIQPFEAQLAVHWKLDPVSATYYPQDATLSGVDPERYRPEANTTKRREGYASIAFLPNLGGNGNVFIAQRGTAEKVAQPAMSKFSSIDHVVNNAAFFRPSPSRTTPPRSFAVWSPPIWKVSSSSRRSQ
jgi:hypothetical protein